MPQDRTAQRAELHRTLGVVAEDLRGSVTGWDFKMYVLGTLFYRFLSERVENVVDAGEREANPNGYTPYAKMDDATAAYGREGLIEDVGYYLAPSDLFCNVWAKAKADANKEHSDLNETIGRILGDITRSAEGHASYKDLQGLFEDYDTNSSKLGLEVDDRNRNLLALLDAVGGLRLGVEGAEIDTFGDAYEYLIAMYAGNAGKSGGEYFTPVEVGRLLAKLATMDKRTVNKAYDPTCGSASLLIRVADEVGHENVKVGLFGQELEPTSYNMARINMFLHNIPFEKFDIALGNTLTNPKHWDDEPFDVIVANMPFSTSWAGDSDPQLVDDPRFSAAGVLAPQKKKADLAFVMHMAAWLANDGLCATVIFPGALYRGGAERKIRKYLVEEGLVSCVVNLSNNLFFGTSVAVSILIMDGSRDCGDILFVDATKEFVKSGNSNMLTPENIDHIVDAFRDRETVDKFCRVVDVSEVAENDYTLSVSTYVDTSEEKEDVDPVALAKEAAEIVERENELRAKVDAFISDYEGWTSGQPSRE